MTEALEDQQQEESRGRDPKVVAGRAKSYFLEAWLPANPVVIRELKKLVSKGEGDATKVLSLLKSDPALFSNRIRECTGRGKDPFSFVSNFTVGEVAKDFPMAPSKVSPHRLVDGSEKQIMQLKTVLIATTVAECLASESNQDPLEAYLLQLYRHIGYSLAAWNYPRIYYRVMQRLLSDTGTLDRSLAKILGYSPTAVGISILKDLGLQEKYVPLISAPYTPPGVKFDGDSEVSSLNPEQKALLETCWVGEVFARRHDGEHFSVKAETVTWATDIINKRLGKRGLNKIERAIDERWKLYDQAQVKGFSDSFSFAARRAVIANGYGRKRYDSNSYVQKCPEAVQEKFLEVYEYIHPGAPSQEGLQALVGDLIPFAGYVSGCIYLVNDANLKLKPTIYIGLARENDFVPVYNSSSVMITDPLLKAYMSGIPVKGKALKKEEIAVTYFASSLGTGERRAILYLEIEDDVAHERKLNPFDCFRAIILCLADALNVECNISALKDATNSSAITGE